LTANTEAGKTTAVPRETLTPDDLLVEWRAAP
jgi:hypothetical protein